MLLKSLVPALVMALLAPLSGQVGAAFTDPGPAPAEASTDGATTGSVQSVDVVVPAAQPAAQPAPDEGQDEAGTVPADADLVVADQPAADHRVETPVIESDGFAVLGLTWPEGASGDDLAPRVRTRDDAGWSAWQPLEIDGGGPDAGTADAATAVRGGTEPIWVGDADAVQVSFAGTAEGGPDGLTLDLVDPGVGAGAGAGAEAGAADDAVVAQAALLPSATAAVATPASRAVATTTGGALVEGGFAPAALAAAATPAPAIVTRAQWGAPATTPCRADVAPALVGAAVHHTASSNAYSTPEQARAAMRGFYAYHTQSRGWCDIGYNFLVDKWGNIYEGRAGSMTKPVIGVHAGGFNTGTVGVSMIGDYSTVVPSAAQQEALARVLAWRLGQYGLNPAGTMVYRTGGGDNSRFPAGTSAKLGVVFAHRDTAFTACPGNGGMQVLPAVRARAQALTFSEPLVRALFSDMLDRAPDPQGLASWTGVLASGASPVAVADALAVSREYAERRVTAAYQRVLGRGPDPQGLRDWTNGVMAGVLRPEDLRGALIASDEYYARSGGTDVAYVARLYRDVLGREASPAEISTWTAVVPASGRAVVPRGVWRSMESASRQVREAYAEFLDRGPDATGLAAWAPVYQATGERSLRAGLVGSAEYRARAYRTFS